ncbi:hypothetical protein D030_2639A, partial [Vibrio parahaemolyticus AQ3810]
MKFQNIIYLLLFLTV